MISATILLQCNSVQRIKKRTRPDLRNAVHSAAVGNLEQSSRKNQDWFDEHEEEI